jgi:serine/threonine protein phosphatase PrpC
MFADQSLFMVADGMGGHQGGEVAANLTVRAVSAAPHSTKAALVTAIETANQVVHDNALERPELHGMGTTATAIAVVSTPTGPRFALANVGDSRIYRYRGDTLHQLTFDHSYVAELIRRGDLTEEEAAVHPYRNMLTRAVGIHPEIEIDHWELDPEPGDRFLLCSDGIINEVADAGIAQVLSRRQGPAEAASELVGTANQLGGRDNSTVVIVDVMLAHPPGAEDLLAAAIPPPEPAAPADEVFDTTFEITADQPVIEVEPELEPEPPAIPLAAPLPPEPEPLPEPAAIGSEPTIVQAAIVPEPAVPEPAAPEAANEPVTPVPFAIIETLDPADIANEGNTNRSWLRQPVGITTRALTIAFALILVLVGFFLATGWYARNSYHVGLAGNEVVIYQGRVGGMLWFDPTLEERTGVLVSELTEEDFETITDGIETASLDGANGFVSDLRTRLTDDDASAGSTNSTDSSS